MIRLNRLAKISGATVDFQYYAIGAQALSITSGALPTGLSMSKTGRVTGRITSSGTFSWVVSAVSPCGVTETLADSAVITASDTPVLDGDFNARVTFGEAVDSTTTLIPRGQWAFIVADINLTNGQLAGYVNNGAPQTFTSPARGQVGCDLVVGGIDYPSNHALTSWRGRLWGIGVANGALTSEERSFLYNAGAGRRFDEISASSDPAAISLWSKIIYAWQLDQDGVWPDAKGNKSLTAYGTVGSVIDAKFGRCFLGTSAGKLQAVGSNAQGLESTSRVTYFAWAFSEVTSSDDFPSIICRYGGFGTYQGIRCYYNSGS